MDSLKYKSAVPIQTVHCVVPFIYTGTDDKLYGIIPGFWDWNKQVFIHGVCQEIIQCLDMEERLPAIPDIDTEQVE